MLPPITARAFVPALSLRMMCAGSFMASADLCRLQREDSHACKHVNESTAIGRTSFGSLRKR